MFRPGSVVASFFIYMQPQFSDPELNSKFLSWYQTTAVTDLVLDEQNIVFNGKCRLLVFGEIHKDKHNIHVF